MNTQDNVMDKPDNMDEGNVILEDDKDPANNNNNTKEVSENELELLRKLEEANR